MPHPADNDHEFLRAFSRDGSESAFSTLVARYTNLVYGTALRKTANPSLAEEAAQTTFAILARKAAGLADHPAPLAAWLHRTATFEASKAARSESRHRRKMDAFTELQPPTAPTDGDYPAWPDLHPHLDDAINRLPAPDRQLVLLHHYQGVALKDVAALTGKSPAATQKQHQRALAKLAIYLHRAGLPAASVTILATGLTAQLTASAPAALAPTFASSALAAAPSLTLTTLTANTILTMSTAKLVTATTAVTVLLASVPLAVQRSAIATGHRTIASLESERDSLRQERDLPPAKSFSAIASPFSTPDLSELGADSIDLATLIDDLNQARDSPSITRMARVMQTIHAITQLAHPELEALATRIAAHDTTGEKRATLVCRIASELDRADPGRSLDLVRPFIAEADSSAWSSYQMAVVGSIRSLASRDPAAAAAWFHAASGDGLFESRSLDTTIDQRLDTLGAVFAGMLEADHATALSFFKDLSPDDQLGALTYSSSKQVRVRANTEPATTESAIGATLGMRDNYRDKAAREHFDQLYAAGASDSLVAAYIRHSRMDARDAKQALGYIAKLTDPQLRRDALARVVHFWGERDSDTLSKALFSAGISNREIQAAISGRP
ncbi:hypothetical protein BH23VER1_BH23VER1_35740 [soil metagenome]